MTSHLFRVHFLRGLVVLPVMGGLLLGFVSTAPARNLIGVTSTPSSSSQNGSSANTATSQTATAATAAAAQAAQAAIISRRAQDSLVQSTTAFQSIQQAQIAAQLAAELNPANNLGSAQNPINGIQVGGLNPIGGVPATQASSIQVVDLGGSGKNQISLGNGGSVTLPGGTAGTDHITLSGAGSVTTTQGSVTSTTGSLATTTGGTLAATNGGTISLTAGSGTLSSTTSATITSTLAGTVTLPSGTTLPLAANQTMTVSAGSSVKFSGTGAGTVTVSGAGTLTLTGAGTLALSNTTPSSGASISANSGTTSFTNGSSVSSLAAGSTVSLTGSGTIDFSGGSGDVLPVIVQPVVSPTGVLLLPPAFSTSGTLLSTTGYNISSLLSSSAWTGVGALSQSFNSSNDQTTVTVTQTQPQALLNWLTFNVGKNTLLDFDQSAGGPSVGDWIAINRILDPSLAPTQILGAIEAPGQVYVINQNGIIFSGSAQVNTHALVASTLPINSNLVTSGLLNNPEGQFLFTSVPDVSSGGTTLYDPSTDPDVLQGAGGNAPSGNIEVAEGATLSSPGSAEGVGGKIALIAPSIDNEGTLSSPDGQIILAAGQQVGFVAHPSSDASLRGLDVAVGSGGGTATNGLDGYIYAPEADVTMTGLNVNQFGVIASGTSVALNGRIDLLAVSGLAPDPENAYIFDSVAGGATVPGTVDLGPNSLTEILPDYSSTDTQVGSTLALPSQIYVEGGTFHMETAAQLIAPNATATFSVGILNTPITTTTARIADDTPPLPENVGAATSGNGEAAIPLNILSTPGQVILDPLANLDVSGSSDVAASVAENIVSAQLTEAVLENSPLQETGPLRGATVQVDITLTGTNPDGSTWYGSPIGDLSGYANLVEHTVGELTVNGGSVVMNTNGSVVINPTSTINVSGGSINYQGAMVQTTKVIAADGQVLDISNATPNQDYLGVDTGFTVSSSKWGVSQTYGNALSSGAYYDAGYVEGGSGGSLTIDTPSVTLGGSLYGNTTAGARQQSAPPASSSFNLAIQTATPGNNPPPVDVVIQPTPDSQSLQNTIYLSPDLFGVDGFGNTTISTGSGTISVAADAVITTAPGGSISLSAANVNIAGRIEVPSGTISVTALTKDPVDLSQGNSVPYDATIGNIVLSSGSVVATTGLTFDETSDVTPGLLPFSVNGGTISLSGATTTLSSGSVVDASGGAARNISDKILDGKGGSISITGSFSGSDGNADGEVVLNGSLSAYGIGQGGSLKIAAPAVQIGGSPQSFPGEATPLVLSSGFFSQGGFSSFTISGSAGVQILTGIAPVLTEEIAQTNNSQLSVALISSSQLPQYPAAPVNLSFLAPGVKGSFVGTLTLGTGDDITTAPTSSVSLNGQLVDILGGIIAPSGVITITGDSTEGLTGQVNYGAPDVTVYLGPQSTLNASGTVITTSTAGEYQTYTTGEVLSGGTISITGNIVADAGSAVVANGAVGTLDVPTGSTAVDLQSSAFAAATNPYVRETLGSNGGSITLSGLEELYFGGTVSAAAGNASSLGGTLTVGSGVVTSSSVPPDAGYPELFISQSGIVSPGAVTLGDAAANGSQTGGGFFTVDQFNAGGFGSLILNGNVQFQTSVTINASQEVQIVPDSQDGTLFANPAAGTTIAISAPYIAIGATTLDINDQPVSNFAPTYVQVGSSSDTIVPATPVPGLAYPTFGAATLSLNATDLIDVGFLSLQNIGTSNFSVATGDIRGGGLLYAAGTVNLTAGQIYTPTAATFTIAAFDAGSVQGTVNIYPGVVRSLPLSAGGTINVYATNINQDGVLEAPFGTINLGALPDSNTGLTPILAGVTFTLNTSTQSYQATPVYTEYAPVTQQLTLGSTSVTSVSGVSSTGQVLDLPYGTILNGTDWIAPNGLDITAGGLPEKTVNLEGGTVRDMTGSLVNLAGGGDLFAYQFSPGVGGTNDILSIDKYSDGSVTTTTTGVPVASTSFAVIPDYGANYAPIDLTVDETGAYPYANSSITGAVGNQVYLAGGDGLAAGTYTILPARYALLPGAYLVTPAGSAAPAQATTNPDGSLEVAGYVYNSLDSNQQIVPKVTGFEVDSSAVVNSRAEYDISTANTFLAASAFANNQPVPRLPVDAGQLVFSATTSLQIDGSLSGQAGAGGLGSTVDIGSPDDIYIVSNNGDTPTLNIPSDISAADYDYLTLSAKELDSFGADSLLIGGIRSTSSTGTTIDPTTNAIYVENDSQSPLSGNEVILVSNQTLTLEEGASIQQSGLVSTNEQNLTIGNSAVLGSGDGTLVRVTGDPNALVTWLGVNTADTTPDLLIDAGASISGVAVTLDSTSGAVLNPAASLDQGVAGQALVLRSGAVSLQIDPNVSLSSAAGLAISNSTLETLEISVERLSLFSYSSINLYGAGTLGGLNAKGRPVVQNLALEGAGIFGYDSGGGIVTINAQNVSFDNSAGGVLPVSTPAMPTGTPGNSLVINADTVNFGANALGIDGYSTVNLTAANDMVVTGTGSLNAQGGLNLTTPMITASSGANFGFNAQGGALAVAQPSLAGTNTASSGLGATISLTGSSVAIASSVSAPSGTINVQATGASGNVELQAGGDLKAGGEAVIFGNVTGYTSGGQVNLSSANGSVMLDPESTADVSAPAAGGNAGTVSVSASNGTFSAASGTMEGTAGTTGAGGTFASQLGQVATLSGLTTPLVAGGFQTLDFDVLTGSVTVDGAVGPALGQKGIASFSLTAEEGAITVDNTINASGVTGGTIELFADEGVTLTGNAQLTVAGQQFDSADEGGLIDIETRGAGAAGNNAIEIEAGSNLNLSVAGGIGGVLHLRAPQTSGGTDLQIDPINGTIQNASSVVLEGYQVYTPAGGAITASLEGSAADNVPGTIYGDAQIFANNTNAILSRLLGVTAPTAAQIALYQVTLGAEIINPTGDLTLSNTWDLSSFRFGPDGVAGDLTLRAAGNLVFTGSLSDGFAYNSADSENVATSPYTWDVLSGPSWSYRLLAGAQFTAGSTSTANYASVQSLNDLGLTAVSSTGIPAEVGSLLLGQNITAGVNFGTQTATEASTYAQLIRTGSGSISIDTGGSVDLLNQLATIYTAGTLAPTLAGFDSPTGTSDSKNETKVYGTIIAPAPQYTAQYTENGGNVAINAQQDIVHLTQDSSGDLILDTSWQFPTNWLYRRGATSSTDVFDTTKLNATEIATTTWWVDFSNFFEGIGALGGGNVTLNAGANIVNVDAVVPTNARMPFADASGNPVADTAADLVQLGGGNLSVIAGGTIAGGTYYVESGTGMIEADAISTVGDTARISAEDVSLGENTPLPLTLFVGDSSFTISATNDLALGSTVNPFLLPQGIGNNFNNESIFSTYAANSSVNVSSLLGNIDIQGSETGGNQLPGSLYDAYLSNASPGGLHAGFNTEQSLTGTPWTLTLDPTDAGTLFIDNVTNYSTFYELSPPIFGATAYAGNIQYSGDQLLAPSSQGTLQLLAAGSIDGAFDSASLGNGLTATITVLDDNPNLLPSVVNPFGLGTTTIDPKNNPSIGAALTEVSALVGETPSYANQSLQTLDSYHTDGLLHAGTTTPVQIATTNGDISDLTLISPEETQISSGLDIQDVSFYLQNNNANDISVVSANRDITPYDPNSTGLVDLGAADSDSVAFGDLQISGPGTLEVLAGRNLNLGEGTSPDNAIGTGLGITSIGNARNPYLPFGGADIIAAAGLGSSSSLGTSTLQFTAFNNLFLNDAGGMESSIYLPDLGALLGLTGASDSQIWDIYSNTPDTSLTAQELKIQAALTPENRDDLATTIFYDVLRDSGRDHNNPSSPFAGTYTEGYAAIAALFPSINPYQGDISLTSREIKTTNGGDIDLLAPGGGIDVGLNNLGTQAIDQGILTVDGGNISIFTHNDVSIGTSRIFTLYGGNIIIWSSNGSIDAGASSKTVQSAPPTRVLVDSQSANVQTDLAGLATGGGIGVLETVIGAPPGNVDLIAPVGTVNAGDAGIRSSGNINVAAAHVLNAGNIQAGGSSTGVPTTSTPNISASVAAASAAGSSQNAASQIANQQQPNQSPPEDVPSIISVEVIGYGGGDDDSAYYSPSSSPAN
jgi:filamentous hemagglutinin